jgi:hypothetical protein
LKIAADDGDESFSSYYRFFPLYSAKHRQKALINK